MNLSIPLNDQDKSYGNETVKTGIDLCKVMEHGDNFLVAMLLEEIETKADIQLSCPFPKVRLSIKWRSSTYLYLSSKFTTCSTSKWTRNTSRCTCWRVRNSISLWELMACWRTTKASSHSTQSTFTAKSKTKAQHIFFIFNLIEIKRDCITPNKLLSQIN